MNDMFGGNQQADERFPSKIWKKNIYRTLMMLGLFVAASSIGFFFRHFGFPDTNIVIVYLLAVLVTSWLARSFIFGFVASLLATFAFNYLFAEPLLAFSVNDPNYIVTLIIMTVIALITSTLTSHAQRNAKEALEKEAETKAIYNLTNHLTDAEDIHAIAALAASAISECFLCNAACLCFDENNVLENTFIQQMLGEKQTRREVEDIEGMKHRIDGMRTGFDVGNEFYDWPIYGRESTLGVIRIPCEKAQSMDEKQQKLLRSIIESTALAMDRFRSADQKTRSREEITMERYRSNLLRAISHDLRTPLSGMIGTSEMLRDMTTADDPRYILVQSLHEDADWLYSMVENILNLTRLQDGRLTIKKEREALEEVIGGAVSRINTRAPDYEILVEVPNELILVPMDAKLIEQVIINLLDNAIRHSKPENEINIFAEQCEGENIVKISIRDRGVGIHEKDLPHLFEVFYTSGNGHSDARKGIGLGLAICETIVNAHGGTISASNQEEGPGATFAFTLPMEEDGNEAL